MTTANYQTTERTTQDLGDGVQITSRNYADGGFPTGGYATGPGMTITWQDGSRGKGIDRQPPTGAQVLDVIEAVLQRVEFLDNGVFSSDQNKRTIEALEAARDAQLGRDADRKTRDVEGADVA